jgi:hypothetical protein
MGRSEVQFSRLYGFVRSRQLDGTFPGDAGTGVWPITACRTERGWGWFQRTTGLTQPATTHGHP